MTKLKTFRYEGERRLRLIADYAHSEECRSVFIRRYFGEDHPPRCGTCDRCRADRVGIGQPELFTEEALATPAENLSRIGRVSLLLKSQRLLTPLLDRAASQQQK